MNFCILADIKGTTEIAYKNKFNIAVIHVDLIEICTQSYREKSKVHSI